MTDLWPHQSEAVEAVDCELERVRSTLIVHATGTGKTTTFAEAIRRRAHFGRALVLAHREELITQGARRIAAQTGLTVAVEMAAEWAPLDADVVVASVQSLSQRRRLERFPPDHFATIVVDEAHHAPARSYRTILDHFTGAKVLGVTATPDRGDKAAMGIVFESVAHEYDIRSGIRDGFLCPIRQRAIIIDGLDFSKCRTTAGDLNEGDLETALMEGDVLKDVAAAIIREAGAVPTIAFTPTVAVAYKLAAELNAIEPESARACDGTTDKDERRETLAAFAAGKFRRLVNCALWTEGFDSPSIASVAVVRPTKSRAFYTQMVGRGTRVCEGKRGLLVLDFRGNAGRHKLVGPLDVLGGSDAVKARAETMCAADPDLDMLRALADAETEITEERRLDVLKRARYRVTDVDPFDLALAALGPMSEPKHGPDPLGLAEQIEWLHVNAPGVKAERMRPTAVAALVCELRMRALRGRASWPQLRALSRAGIDVDLSLREAALAVAVLSRNGWRATGALTAALQLPADDREAALIALSGGQIAARRVA